MVRVVNYERLESQRFLPIIQAADTHASGPKRANITMSSMISLFFGCAGRHHFQLKGADTTR